MKTLLVTGANGFTGRHLIPAAAALGYNPYALTANLIDAEAVAAEVTNIMPSHVIHLAGISAITHADEMEIYRVNLFGTINLLKALAALPYTLNKVLLTSSANIYGSGATSPISEASCPAPVNHYATSKLAMEHMALTFASKLPIVIARPFNYTGVGHDKRFVIPKLTWHFAQRTPTIALGNLHVEREFNDVRTVCSAYIKLLEFGRLGQAYNICSGKAVNLQAVFDILSNLTGHKPTIEVNPAFIRQNEIPYLYGSPSKLEACIGKLVYPALQETLLWMLESVKND
ncbi:NAD-dependent epimerase/dehydratase family protein [Thiothrix unzii]|uniref:NAD-dependent epimerase/dehydratase family protein n=1 Tax=Thiothrix unzii TaxID=111769 RepID=A0A975F8Y1_9GAMM|nr:NAD-dependent epimerase/dehydratase family protein [Thiothrix unzii]QTR52605.1 NAD-dependent epimerase/dehydratase family protein [Thiothrix unzii]